MKKFLKLISICFIVLAIMTTTTFAADTVAPISSKYIAKTSVGIIALGNGKIEVDFSITATGTMPDVGARIIGFYSAATDECVAKYYYTDSGYEYMMGHNVITYDGGVTYKGVPGQRYYAKVTFFSGEYGVAGGIYTMASAYVTAK